MTTNMMLEPVIKVPNTDHPRRRPTPPRKENGDSYRWELVPRARDYRYYSDSTDALMSAIASMRRPLTLEEIRNHAEALAALIQWDIIRQYIADGTQASAEEAKILRGEAPHGDFWDSEIPLVLIDFNYRPHTEAFPPLTPDGDVQEPSNILWIRTGNTEEYLTSLNNAGWINLNLHLSNTP